MSLLSERWPGLTDLPRISIASLPTPVERLSGVSEQFNTEIWCKRDDRTAADYGGNKVRKLEYLFGHARARNRNTLVTAGAMGSHHVLATTIHGTQRGFEVHAIVAPQPWTDHVEENLRADLAAGAVLHPVKSFAAVAPKMLTVAATLRLQGKRPYLIPPGGSSSVGAVGYVEAGLELARQIDDGLAPEPDAVYVACGSGGTLAGISIGLAAAGVMSQVVAVRVTPRSMIHKLFLRRLIRSTIERLREADGRFPDVFDAAMRNLRLEHGEYGPGYGLPTEEARRAQQILAKKEGIQLDLTYTAKTFAALLADAIGHRNRKRLLYWHTLSSADMTELISEAPPAPDWARALSAQVSDA